MDIKGCLKEIIPKRLYYRRNPDKIKFFFKMEDGLFIWKGRFKIYPGKPRTHILIRTPILCIERGNIETKIGNQHQLVFCKKIRKDGGADNA